MNTETRLSRLDFREPRTGEVRRTLLPGDRVNKRPGLQMWVIVGGAMGSRNPGPAGSRDHSSTPTDAKEGQSLELRRTSHNQRRTNKKIANTTTTASTTSRMTSKAKGISFTPPILGLLPQPRPDRLQSVPDRGPGVAYGSNCGLKGSDE
jgi:hypothetical protein